MGSCLPILKYKSGHLSEAISKVSTDQKCHCMKEHCVFTYTQPSFFGYESASMFFLYCPKNPFPPNIVIFLYSNINPDTYPKQ